MRRQFEKNHNKLKQTTTQILIEQSKAILIKAFLSMTLLQHKYCSTMTGNPQIDPHKNHQCSSNLSQTILKPYIGHFHETPEYMRDDKLSTGYRINFNSYGQILRSLFQIHNETVNIWTHFGGALIMICIVLSIFSFEMQQEKVVKPFQTTIQKYSPESTQCHAQTVEIIEQALLPSEIEQKLKHKICHPHGKIYFGDFVCEIAADQISLIKNYFLHNFGENMKKIETIKLHWEQDVIPNIFHEIERQSDFSAFNYIKQKIEQLQVKMDEEQYEYLDFGEHLQNPQKVSRFPLIIFLFCAIVCLGCSSAFHLFNPMSSRAYNISIGLDYAGINIFIAGSVFPAFYYGMYCYFNVAYFYMTIIMLIGSTLFILSLTEWFKKPQNFVLKSLCYGGFAFFLLFPISHLVINEIFFHNYGDQFSFLPSLHWYLLGAASDLLGLIVFTKRCPDRNNPGKYDVCGHSHQIWHSLILLGMFFLYFGACTNYETRKEFSCPAHF